MTPEPYDTPLRWLVASASRAEEFHLVDLGEGEKGECTCEDFVCRKRVCKHIRIVREYVADLIIARLRQNPQPKPEPTAPDGTENNSGKHSV